MEYIGYGFIVILLINTQSILMISTIKTRALSTQDLLQNIPVAANKVDWESGLRESTFQALQRENFNDIRLKAKIYEAPILGYQDSATPFGDIIVIARGQFYNTVLGYQFVQDLYQNDCDDCHNRQEVSSDDRSIIHQNRNKQLVALWTVKRIRHRDSSIGHRYELQFTISPISSVAPANFVTRNGRIDYNIPGHVFVVKLWETQPNSFTYNRNKYEQKILSGSSNREVKRNPQWSPHDYPSNHKYDHDAYRERQTQRDRLKQDHLNSRYLIGISQDGHKHVIPEIASTTDRYTTNKYHYKEPVRHYHHHYYIPEDDEIFDLKVKPVPPTIIKEQTHFVPSIPPTAPSDLPHKFIFGTQFAPPQQSSTPQQSTTYKLPDTVYTNPPTYFKPTPNIKTTRPNLFTDGRTVYQIITTPSVPSTQSTPISPSPFYIQYSEPDPTYNNNEPPTVSTPMVPTKSTVGSIISHIKPPVHIPSRKRPFDSEEEKPVELDDIFGKAVSTTAATITTQKYKYPDSINAQLPPPEKGVDVTIPYVASTVAHLTPTKSTTRNKYSDSSEEDINVFEPELPTTKSKIIIKEKTTKMPIINTTRKRITTQKHSLESEDHISVFENIKTTSMLPETTKNPRLHFIPSAPSNTFRKPIPKIPDVNSDSEEDVNIFDTDIITKKPKTPQTVRNRTPNIHLTSAAIANRQRKPVHKITNPTSDSDEDVNVFDDGATVTRTKPSTRVMNFKTPSIYLTPAAVTNRLRRPTVKFSNDKIDSNEEDVNVFETKLPTVSNKTKQREPSRITVSNIYRRPNSKGIQRPTPRLPPKFVESEKEDVNAFNTDTSTIKHKEQTKTGIPSTQSTLLYKEVIKTTATKQGTSNEEDVNIFEEDHPTTENQKIKNQMTTAISYSASPTTDTTLTKRPTISIIQPSLKEIHSTSGYLPPRLTSTERTRLYSSHLTTGKRATARKLTTFPIFRTKMTPETTTFTEKPIIDTTTIPMTISSEFTTLTQKPETYLTTNSEIDIDKIVTVPPTNHFLPNIDYENTELNKLTVSPVTDIQTNTVTEVTPETISTTANDKVTTVPQDQTTYSLSNFNTKITTVLSETTNFDKYETTHKLPISVTTTQIYPTKHTIVDTVSPYNSHVESGTIDENGRLPIENEGIFKNIKIPGKVSENRNMDSLDFDIFGTPQKQGSSNTTNNKPKTLDDRKVNYEDIFSNFSPNREESNKYLRNHTPKTNSSLNPRNTRFSKYLKYRKNRTNRLNKFFSNKTEEENTQTEQTTLSYVDKNIETKTSQSLITSISFKVNKPNVERTTVPMHKDIKEMITSPKSEHQPDENHGTLDNFAAQSLVNHANVVTYLNSKTTRPARHRYRPTHRPQNNN